MSEARREVHRAVVRGHATVTVGGEQSLPFGFELNVETGAVSIERLDIGGLKVWFRRVVDRQRGRG